MFICKAKTPGHVARLTSNLEQQEVSIGYHGYVQNIFSSAVSDRYLVHLVEQNVDRRICLGLLMFTDQKITNKNHNLVQKTVYRVVRII